MNVQFFTFMGREVPFQPGQTIASALLLAGHGDLGHDHAGQPLRYFCGIGACQSCLAVVDGQIRETCLTPARAGQIIKTLEAHLGQG